VNSVEQVAGLHVGDPTDAATAVGPLIRPSEVDWVEAWVNEAVEQGAVCALGGKRLDRHFFAPTVLVDPPVDAKVSNREIFGPVVCVYGYDSAQDAIRRANALPVAFQAAVFTTNIDFAVHTAQALDASAVMVNDHTAFRVDWMPFAGRRTSGLGVGGIPNTLADMMQDKLLVIRPDTNGTKLSPKPQSSRRCFWRRTSVNLCLRMANTQVLSAALPPKDPAFFNAPSSTSCTASSASWPSPSCRVANFSIWRRTSARKAGSVRAWVSSAGGPLRRECGFHYSSPFFDSSFFAAL